MPFVFHTQYAHDAQPKEPAAVTPAGIYPAKIFSSEELVSKSGKPMLKLGLEVDAGGTKTLDINEYLLLEAASAWKLEQYLAAIGFQFSAGQELRIDANSFLGGRLAVLTYNEPGMKNPDRLYAKILRAFRPADVTLGPLSEKALEGWGLNPDGTRRGSRDEQRANAQPHQHQSAWGQQPAQNSGWGSPQQNGWGAPQAAPATPPPAINENLEDDDIPF